MKVYHLLSLSSRFSYSAAILNAFNSAATTISIDEDKENIGIYGSS
jgi:hypothetical protein